MWLVEMRRDFRRVEANDLLECFFFSDLRLSHHFLPYAVMIY